MLDRISFVLGEAFIALRRNRFMTFASISTVALSFFLLGGMTYVFWRTNEYAKTIPGKFEMRVFLKDGMGFADVKETATQIRKIPGVAVVSWIPRDKAWDRFRVEHPDVADVENPLPHSYKVTINNLDLGDSVASHIQKLPTVREGGVQYLADVQRFIDQMLKVLRLLGLSGGGILLVTGGILIFNAIRLTIVSRRLEIRIMQLVGASGLTLKTPFIIEGLVQGAFGGLLSACLIDGAQLALQSQITTFDAFASLPPFPFVQALVILGTTGAAFGALCSLAAVHFPMKAE